MKGKNGKILLAVVAVLLVLAAVMFAIILWGGEDKSDISYTPHKESAGDTTEVISPETQGSTEVPEESTTVPTKPETQAATKPKEKVYKIRYSGLEGATHSNPATYTAKTAAQVVLKSPSARPGYQFAGWYVGEALVTSLAGRTGDLTVTAKWVQQITEGIELPIVPF